MFGATKPAKKKITKPKVNPAIPPIADTSSGGTSVLIKGAVLVAVGGLLLFVASKLRKKG